MHFFECTLQQLYCIHTADAVVFTSFRLSWEEFRDWYTQASLDVAGGSARDIVKASADAPPPQVSLAEARRLTGLQVMFEVCHLGSNGFCSWVFCCVVLCCVVLCCVVLCCVVLYTVKFRFDVLRSLDCVEISLCVAAFPYVAEVS